MTRRKSGRIEKQVRKNEQEKGETENRIGKNVFLVINWLKTSRETLMKES